MKILFAIIFSLFAFFLLVRYLEGTSIFYPSRNITSIPSDIGLPYEDIFVTTQDGYKIHGWYIKSPEAKATVLFFHGNAGNLSNRLEKILMFHQIPLNVFIIDYRGYGKSEGRPSEAGMYKDAEAAFDYLITREDVDSKKIIAYGASLGGVVAIDLAGKRNVACLITDSSFTKAADMGKIIYPFIPTILLKSKMDSESKVRRIDVPKLFIHAIQDEIVPLKLGQRLFDAAIEPKKFLKVEGNHNSLFFDSRAEIFDGIKEFLKGLSLI